MISAEIIAALMSIVFMILISKRFRTTSLNILKYIKRKIKNSYNKRKVKNYFLL